MTATRSSQEEISYRKARKSAPQNCPFCEVRVSSDSYVDQSDNFFIIKNNFPYSLWEAQGVDDHLMVIPKKHILSLKELSPEQSKEYVDILKKYEDQNYNVYLRSINSSTRSVLHHHTHLLKTDNKHRKFVILFKWPMYIRMSF